MLLYCIVLYVILHNILLIHDGLDTRYISEEYWTNLDPDGDCDNEEFAYGPLNQRHRDDYDLGMVFNITRDISYASFGKRYGTTEFDFDSKVNDLINHHRKQFLMGLLMWPKSFNKMRKKKIMYYNRAEQFLYESLYIKKSDYIGRNRHHIGYGLYSNIKISKDTTIGKYIGKIISTEQRLRREFEGKGGYFIHIDATESLDCYDERQTKTCKMSFINSYVNAISGRITDNAIQNARIVVHAKNKSVSVKNIKDIRANEEIFIDYGDQYIHVPFTPITLSSISI